MATADDIVLRKKDTRTTVAAPRDPSLFCDRLVVLGSDQGRRQRLGRLVQDAAREEPPGII